jgi:hypothetical protein
VNPDVLEVLFVNLIASCNLPMRFTECEAFRAIIQYLNNLGSDILPESHVTLHTWVERQWEASLKTTKSYLAGFQSKIHISMDGWKSDNGLSVLGFVAQGVDASGELVSLVLGMQQIKGPHTGEAMAPFLYQILVDYGMSKRPPQNPRIFALKYRFRYCR